MIVAGNDEHAAIGRTAVGVAMLQTVARAIDAGTFAVPDTENAIDSFTHAAPYSIFEDIWLIILLRSLETLDTIVPLGISKYFATSAVVKP